MSIEPLYQLYCYSTKIAILITRCAHTIAKLFNQQNRNNSRIRQQMKDECLPQIPQENDTQAQSMYQQLRKSSQQWFDSSNRKVFNNLNRSSTDQPSSGKGQISQRLIPANFSEWENTNKDNNEKIQLIRLMKEQIEISSEFYAKKMKVVLNDQARKIKLLGDLLVKNQIEIAHKNKIIEELTTKIQNNSSLPVLTQKYNLMTSKLSSAQENMRNICNKVQLIHEGQNQILLKLKKVDKLYKNKILAVSQHNIKYLEHIRQELEDRLDRIEKNTQLAQCQSKNNKRGSINDKIMFENIFKNMTAIRGQIDDLKDQINSSKKKKYKYQNYKLEELQSKIQLINKKLQRYSSQQSKSEPQQYLKASQTTHMTRTGSNCSTKPLNSSKTRFLNRYKSLINTRQTNCQEQSRSSSEQAESEVQQTLIEQDENIDRLMRILHQMNIKKPMRIQIDQTGYAKSTDTGMYLVDSLGDGFQFTPQEINYLKKNKIVQIDL